MKYLLFLSPLLLAGCLGTTAPVVQKFPEVNKELLVACPDLRTVDPETTKLTDVLEVVVENYKEYYECKAKVDDWIFWYNEQKKIFEKVK